MLRWRGTITAAECHLMTVFLESKVWKMIYIPELSAQLLLVTSFY
jgi:hypothetical protein